MRPLPPLSRRAALTGSALAALGVPLTAGAAHALGSGGVRTHDLSGARDLLSSGRAVAVGVDGGSMLGVVFGDGPVPAAVAVRVTRAGSGPGEWTDLPVEDGATDPVWTGELGRGALVEVRLPSGVRGARLAVVDPGPGPARGRDLAAGADRPAVRSRADWGADESLRRGEPAVADTVRAAIVHHTADGGRYTRAEVPAVIRGTYRYHTQTLGWDDLGYNVLVDRFGGIWEGRAGGLDRPVVGAHAAGVNTGTFGVSMMGDFTAVAPTDACLQSVAAVIAWKFSLHGVDARGRAQLTASGGGSSRFAAGQPVTIDAISGHRDVGFTACPGDVGYTRMDDVRARVAALQGSPGGSSPIARKHATVAALLGAPTSAEGDALRGGRFRHYEHGSIYHQPALGTHVVRGSHTGKYASLGWEWSALGFPTADTTNLPGGVGSFTHFEHGSIYRRDGHAPHVVLGAIRGTWAARGWENSPLGFPVSDEYDVPGGRASDFEGGRLRWDAATGRVS
ncbi:N-acetylmuramoyl-L-alanine amidase [Kineococcus rhizosphaerae]|uniref:LGFP repeat-containing protein n=1 Tax=Kineococcus rhizosphaerae TaxID=559628 RepID=A0A2T0R0D1_9ACTN|nr:N-acetylmuramoyl-L-alanine amidase [Kineococcus rhizosphaerae]PRY12565.1 LGFP repeat-containing protein [Kineococcus rhizosphaerae]